MKPQHAKVWYTAIAIMMAMVAHAVNCNEKPTNQDNDYDCIEVDQFCDRDVASANVWCDYTPIEKQCVAEETVPYVVTYTHSEGTCVQVGDLILCGQVTSTYTSETIVWHTIYANCPTH